MIIAYRHQQSPEKSVFYLQVTVLENEKYFHQFVIHANSEEDGEKVFEVGLKTIREGMINGKIFYMPFFQRIDFEGGFLYSAGSGAI